MSKLFCSNSSCAKATSYEGMKPKFCSHCGEPFDSAFKSVAIKLAQPSAGFHPQPNAHPQPKAPKVRPIPQYYQRPAQRQMYDEFGEPIENEDYEVPQTFEIKASIVGETRKIKMGELAKAPVDRDAGERSNGGQFDVKQILAEAQRSMSKQSISDVGGE